MPSDKKTSAPPIAGSRLNEKIEALPARPGVYLFKDAAGGILYVGKARVLRDRVRSYFQAAGPEDPRKSQMVASVSDLELIVTDNEIEALALENNLIKRHRPPFNVLLRDDKNHPYLKLTLAEEYPRLLVVRRVGEDGHAYGGPYIPASLARQTAAVIHRAFGVRSCREQLDGHRPRPCLQHQIGRCLAPCVASICALPRYRESCEQARQLIEGHAPEVLRHLREQMEAAAQAEHYEVAARLRNQLRTVEQLEAPQKMTTVDLEERDVFGAHLEGERAAVQVFQVRDGRVVGRDAYLIEGLAEPETLLGSSIQQYYAAGRYVPREILAPWELPERELLETWLCARRATRVHIRVPQRGEKSKLLDLVLRNAHLAFDLEWRHPRRQAQEILRSLRELLELEVEPRRIECFDISNIQGADVVASMVAFVDGAPKKSDYRKFKVRGLHGQPDDFASMREVVGRRYRRLLEQSQDLPDLVLVDGGPGQLGAAVAALEELGLGDQPVASLAKREELIFVRGRDQPISLPRASPVLQLMQRARDEAHRFAVGYHRTARRQRTLRSALDEIPGVGSERRRRLLSRFGSVRGIRAASEAELAAVVGPALATRIRTHLGSAPEAP